MKCEDCLYYEVCPLGLAIKGSTGTCLKFKNKADVVEVTRCSNCKYIETFTCPITRTETLFCDYGEKPAQVAAEHYCGYGERKDM